MKDVTAATPKKSKKRKQKSKEKTKASNKVITNSASKIQEEASSKQRKIASITKEKNAKTINKNPLLEKFNEYSRKNTSLDKLFCTKTTSHSKRSELLEQMSDYGETLVNSYAWAIPNERCFRILKHFSPIIEIGCGTNAYWSTIMKDQYNIDVIAFDIDVEEGGQIRHSTPLTSSNNIKKKKRKNKHKQDPFVQKGSAEVLATSIASNRTLFLCYPDQFQDPDTNLSLGISCLEKYQGQYLIHVGELHSSQNVCISQAPYGRSSSPDFQDELYRSFHCILKIRIPSWVHVNDTLSVWKRSERCEIFYEGDDDSAEEVVEYKYIPLEERLPEDVVAPCLQHLLEEKS